MQREIMSVGVLVAGRMLPVLPDRTLKTTAVVRLQEVEGKPNNQTNKAVIIVVVTGVMYGMLNKKNTVSVRLNRKAVINRRLPTELLCKREEEDRVKEVGCAR